MSMTWVMKRKTNGKFNGRFNGQGYEQLAGKHYQSDSIDTPVTNH
jgi:hypothetical protein